MPHPTLKIKEDGLIVNRSGINISTLRPIVPAIWSPSSQNRLNNPEVAISTKLEVSFPGTTYLALPDISPLAKHFRDETVSPTLWEQLTLSMPQTSIPTKRNPPPFKARQLPAIGSTLKLPSIRIVKLLQCLGASHFPIEKWSSLINLLLLKS